MNRDPLSELAYDAEPGMSRDDYLAAALEALTAAFPSDSVGWNSLNTVTGHVEVIGTPAEVFSPQSPSAAALVRVHDHPMVTSYLVRREGYLPRRLSDLVSLTELHRTETYAELLHPVAAEYQFTVLTHRDAALAGCWTFNRASHDFSDDDLELAGHLQGMLTLIDRTWPATDHLPVDTPLTPRETEVLALIAVGLTSYAIGSRLGISRATVGKHLEHAYRKLGVGDRLLAVDAARRLGFLSR